MCDPIQPGSGGSAPTLQKHARSEECAHLAHFKSGRLQQCERGGKPSECAQWAHSHAQLRRKYQCSYHVLRDPWARSYRYADTPIKTSLRIGRLGLEHFLEESSELHFLGLGYDTRFKLHRYPFVHIFDDAPSLDFACEKLINCSLARRNS